MTVLVHIITNDKHVLVLRTDDSTVAISAQLQKIINSFAQSLPLLSWVLQPEQSGCSTSESEPLAVDLAILHFWHILKDRKFTFHTDYKPLTCALTFNNDCCSPKGI